MKHKGLRAPHLLLASSNPTLLLKNLPAILTRYQIRKIDAAISAEAAKLFLLGEEHFNFAHALPQNQWRQKVSRLYYGAYNVKRAVSLRFDGSFATDASDHQRVGDIPSNVQNRLTYSERLKDLREDRNLADYSHLAVETDLLNSVADYDLLVAAFIVDARAFLVSRGVAL